MSGNVTGGRKAAAKNLENNPNFYKEIGSKGGRNGKGSQKGFAYSPEKAQEAGSKGGSKSRRGYTFLYEEDGIWFYRHKKTGDLSYYVK